MPLVSTCKISNKDHKQAFNSMLVALLFSLLKPDIAFSSDNPKPTLDVGAKVYVQRCVLCHGKQGMGEGILPLKIKDYPNANLVEPKRAKSRQQIYEVVIYGGYAEGINDAMPPYGQELSWTETESVVDFVMYFRREPKLAAQKLAQLSAQSSPRKQQGKAIFDTRCVLCHGEFGEGNGRMSKILKAPPPFDLTSSRVDKTYMQEIIKRGGEGVGRSKHMPPWGDQLSDSDIDALIEYLITIRD